MALNTQRFMASAWVSIVPSLAYTMHKGSCGRIAVVGGSSDYSGAPYFAAMAGMRAGADLAYVLCPPEAALAIKAYSPELCVRPLLTSNTMEECERVMKSCHAVILGPGIGDGTDEQRDRLLPRVVTAVRAAGLPLVIDTSVMTFPKVVEALRSTARGADEVEAPTYLTPNGREVQLLVDAVLGEGEAEKYKAADDAGKRELAARVAHTLRCVVMVKGHEDVVVDGWTTRGEPAANGPADLRWGTVCHVSGGRDPSPRRAAGQGDVLAGTLGCFAAWAKLAKHPSANDGGSSSAGLVAPMLASLVVRDAARSAYDELHRSMVASDVLQRIGARFNAIDESLRKGKWPPHRL